MARLRALLLGLVVTLPALSACNAEDPLRPESFNVAEVYGEWKIAAESGACSPARIQMTIGAFSLTDPDVAAVTGRWFIDDGGSPQSTNLSGQIDRHTGEARFTMYPTKDITLEGIFFTNEEFIGAWHDASTECRARYRGLKIR